MDCPKCIKPLVPKGKLYYCNECKLNWYADLLMVAEHKGHIFKAHRAFGRLIPVLFPKGQKALESWKGVSLEEWNNLAESQRDILHLGDSVVFVQKVPDA